MRNKIRGYSMMVAACMLILSITGCAGVPAGNTDPTPGPSQSPGASSDPGGADQTDAPSTPAPAETAYTPVMEEALDAEALDAWIDMRIAVMDNANLSALRDFIASSLTVVPAEVADAMVWEYIKAMRAYLDTMTRYILDEEMQMALLTAYQPDGSFDRSMLDEGQNNLIDETEDLGVGWVAIEGMIEPRIQYDRITEWTGSVSAMMREYVELLAMDTADAPAVDGALQIGYGELGDRVLRIEGFLGSVADTPYLGDVEDMYVRYLDLFLSGADTPSVLDIERYYESDTLAMNPDAEAAFAQVLERGPQSATAAAVTDWRSYLGDLIESGASGEAAYQQIWDNFFVRMDRYVSAAGVRMPRVFLAVSADEIDTDIFKARMEYPLFYGDGIPDGALAEVENRITADIQQSCAEIQDAAAPDHDAVAEDGHELPPYGFYSALRLSRKAGSVISVVGDMDMYTGGAHGIPYRAGYNFDPMTGDEIVLADIFKSGADPWALLEEDITRQIELIRDRYSEIEGDSEYVPYDLYEGLSEPHEWYVTDEGITVIFTAYEIAPYAAGIPEFTVPWWRLSDYLK